MPAIVQGASPVGLYVERMPIPNCSNEVCSKQTLEKCVACNVHFCSKRCMVIGYANHQRDCISAPAHSNELANIPNTNSYQQPTVDHQYTLANLDNGFVADREDVSAEVVTGTDSTMSNDRTKDVTTDLKRVYEWDNIENEGNRDKLGGENNNSFVRRNSKTPTKVTKDSGNKGYEQSTKVNRRSFRSNKNVSPNKFNNGRSDQKFKQCRVQHLKVGDIFKMRILELDIFDKDCRKDIFSLKVINDELIYQSLYDSLSANVIDVEVETLENRKNYVCQKDGKWVRVYIINIYENDVLVRYPDLKTTAYKVPKNIFREYPSQCEQFPPATKRAHFVDDTNGDILWKCFEEGRILNVKVVEVEDGNVLALKLIEIGEKPLALSGCETRQSLSSMEHAEW